MVQKKFVFANGVKAAKSFSRRYKVSLGGGWFKVNGKKVQGLYHLALELYRSGAIHGYGADEKPYNPSHGRVTMIFDLLDPIYGTFISKSS